MPLGVRIFLVYFLFVGLTGYFVLDTVMEEIRPGVRQSTEETLVDTANLLAEILRDDLKAGTLTQSNLPILLQAYGQRHPNATIWGIEKSGVNHRIYVTDSNGIVLLDSSGIAVGQDYSRWNDVYLTLRGRYGVRSTQEIEGDEKSTVMYVAAPIIDGEKIIGAVTVAKPNSSVQPYIDRSQRRLGWFGGSLIALSLLIGGMLAWWLSHALRQLTQYAGAVSRGERTQLPQYSGGELAQLATAIESMRSQLEGKAYVEHYVQTLTHELKSPLAAIRASAELLQDDMPHDQQQRFITNIDSESQRLQQLIERLLSLAMVEQRQQLEERVDISLRKLSDECLASHSSRIVNAEVFVENAIAAELSVTGEKFLLNQALSNLIDNALDFTDAGGLIRISAEKVQGGVSIVVYNQGDSIPGYALPRLIERFYSLPRPRTGRKSTGLGLNFVNEVALLHGGKFSIANVDSGVNAVLFLPL